MLKGRMQVSGAGYRIPGPAGVADDSFSHRLRRADLFCRVIAVVIMATPVFGQEAPEIDFFSPTGGPEGTVVTLYGANFDVLTPANNTVLLNGVAVEMGLVKDSEVSFKVPAGAATGLIEVSTTAGKATSTEPFVVSPLTLSVTPSLIHTATNTMRPLTALVTGAPNGDVTWLVNGIEGGNADLGIVSASNPTTYTAPAAVPSPASVRVTAVCAANPQVMAHARVTIFSMLAGIPDLELAPLRLNEFSRDPETGIMMGRMRIIVVIQEGASTAGLAAARA